jgi:hypothetical protein
MRNVKLLYSSSRLVTLCLSPIVFPTGDEFQWSEISERLVRAHAIVGVFPAAQLLIEPGWVGGSILKEIEGSLGGRA